LIHSGVVGGGVRAFGPYSKFSLFIYQENSPIPGRINIATKKIHC
jgi:hypothetical protein